LNILNQISQTNTVEKQNGRSLTRENKGIERKEPQDLQRLLAHRGIVSLECVGDASQQFYMNWPETTNK
jgi:hypothetical protein